MSGALFLMEAERSGSMEEAEEAKEAKEVEEVEEAKRLGGGRQQLRFGPFPRL